MRTQPTRSFFYVSVLLLACLGTTQAQYASCLRRLRDHSPENASVNGVLSHAYIANLIGTRLDQELGANHDETASPFREIYEALREKNGAVQSDFQGNSKAGKTLDDTGDSDHVLRLECQQTFDLLISLLDIQSSSQECLDLAQVLPLDQEQFASAIQQVDARNHRLSHSEQHGVDTLMLDVFMDFQNPETSLIEEMHQSAQDMFCQRILLAKTLSRVVSSSSTNSLMGDSSAMKPSESVPVPVPSIVQTVPASAPALRPTLRTQSRMGQLQSPTLISVNQRMLNDVSPEPTLNDSDFGMCKYHLFTSNRDYPRDSVISRNEFVYVLNDRFDLNLPTDIPFGSLNNIYQQAFFDIQNGPLNNGAVGIDITGTIPNTDPNSISSQQNENLRYACSELERAHQAVLASIDPVPTTAPNPPSPTQAPVSGTTPAPTSASSFRNKCNLAVLLNENETGGLGIDIVEYVLVLRSVAADKTLGNGPIGNSFLALPEPLKEPFNSYGLNIIPIQGALGTRTPALNQFCDRLHAGISQWKNPSPTPPPTNAPTKAPTPMPTPVSPGSTPSPVASLTPGQFSFCLDALETAEVQNDNGIDQAEFLAFLNELTTGVFSNVPVYGLLDPALKEVFDDAADSGFGGGGVVDITGFNDIENASNVQEAALKSFCSNTFEGIRKFNEGTRITPTDPPAPSPGAQSACFQGMVEADNDGDQTLSMEEYVAYASSISGNRFADLAFNKTPYILQDNFEWIRGLDDTLDIAAAISPTTALQTQRTLLTSACARTSSVVTLIAAGNSLVPLQDHCFAALARADGTNDNLLSEDEFVSFVNFFLGVQYRSSFNSLDSDFRRFFNSNRGSNGAIGIDGAKPNQTPSQVQLLSLNFLCNEMGKTVENVRKAFVSLEKCRLSAGAANTNSDNTLTQAEFVVFVYTMADANAFGLRFQDLDEEVQSFYTNFTSGFSTVDFKAWVAGGSLTDQQRTSVVDACTTVNALAQTIEPPSTTTIFSSFIVANDANILATNITNTTTEYQTLEIAYEEFVKREIATLAASSAANRRFLRSRSRGLQAVGVVNGSPELYRIDDVPCPASAQGSSNCQTAYGRFELIFQNETDENAFNSQVTDTLQQAIANRRLQEELEKVDPNSKLSIVGPGTAVQPQNEKGKEDDDDDGWLSIPVLIGIIGGAGLICCIAGVLVYVRSRQKPSPPPPPMKSRPSRKSKTRRGSKRPSKAGQRSDLPTISEDMEDSSSRSEIFKDEPQEYRPEQPDFPKFQRTPSQDVSESESESETESSEEPGMFVGSNQQSEWKADVNQQQPQQQAAPEQQQGQNSWVGQGAWGSSTSTDGGTSFFQDSGSRVSIEETTYHSNANQSAGSGTVGAQSTHSVEPPPDAPFENDATDFDGSNTFGGANAFGAPAATTTAVAESGEESSSYDSETAGEKVKPPPDAQAMYGYEYTDEDFEGLSSSEEDTSEYESDEEEETEEEATEGEAEEETSAPVDPELQRQYRETIEALVQEVVPDEIEHVDAMMEQFVGREEELINTLRNMTSTGSSEESSSGEEESGSSEEESGSSEEESGSEDGSEDGSGSEESGSSEDSSQIERRAAARKMKEEAAGGGGQKKDDSSSEDPSSYDEDASDSESS